MNGAARKKIILVEVNQIQKDKYGMYSLTCECMKSFYLYRPLVVHGTGKYSASYQRKKMLTPTQLSFNVHGDLPERHTDAMMAQRLW